MSSSVYGSSLHVINLLVHRVPRSIFVLWLLLLSYSIVIFLFLFRTPRWNREGYKTSKCNLGHGPLQATLFCYCWECMVYNSVHSNNYPTYLFFFHTKHCRAICLSLFAAAGFSLISYSFGHSFPVTAICTIIEIQNVIWLDREFYYQTQGTGRDFSYQRDASSRCPMLYHSRHQYAIVQRQD